jgi:RNA polymerase sigma-70 factor (ECF subfamily)
MDRKQALDRDLGGAFKKRGRELRAIARRAGDQDAADLVQDAFVRTLQAGRKNAIRNPVHLLYRVARNLVVDRLRRRARWAKVTVADPEADALDPVSDPERRLIAAERLRRAIAAIDAMPPRRREVFLLHRLEELSYVEISRRLGISISAVEKHMRLAMAQLAREVD